MAAAHADVADAAPNADVVIVWSAEPAPVVTARIGDAARRAGAAMIDISPAVVTPPDARALVTRGIDAYNALEFDAGLTALDAAADVVDRTGGGGLDRVGLGDLFLYRALVYVERGDDARSWDDFITAASIDPTRVLDPARFSPRAIDQHTRAIAAVGARERGTVTVAPADCAIDVDGTPLGAGSIELGYGRHWLAARCPGHQPAGQRVELDRPQLALDVAGPEIAPPTDDALAIQGRTAGARTIIAVAIRGGVATVRRLGPDARELDRASVPVAGDADAPAVADAVAAQLAPRAVAVHRTPWYKSRWVWAAAGATVAAAILLPLALRDTGPPAVNIELGNPW